MDHIEDYSAYEVSKENQEKRDGKFHMIAVDDSLASEVAWEEMKKHVDKEKDTVLVSHSPARYVEGWVPVPTQIHAGKRTYPAKEEIYQKYHQKCKEAGFNCKIADLSEHLGPSDLASTICVTASALNVDELWVGNRGTPHVDRNKKIAPMGSISVRVAEVCPCNVHVCKSQEQKEGFFVVPKTNYQVDDWVEKGLRLYQDQREVAGEMQRLAKN